MAKELTLTCLRLDPNEIRLAVVETVSGNVLRRELLSPGFPVLLGSGAVAHPERLASFLMERFDKLQLPLSVKVAIGLKYMDIKMLTLPALPPGEREAIIRDEAARESIFSYSGEPVAVAYRVFNSSSKGNPGLTVLTATTPQDVIQSAMNLMDQAGLKLLTIEPSFSGIQRYITKHLPEAQHGAAVLAVYPTEAELFILKENAPPLFWRHLSAGISHPERLESDTTTSIAHYNSRASAGTQVNLLHQIGLELPSPLSVGLEVRHSSAEPWPDLIGLGIQETKVPSFTFFQDDGPKSGQTFSVPVIIGGVIILLAIVVNIATGWRLLAASRRIIELRMDITKEQKAIAVQQGLLGASPAGSSKDLRRFNVDEFMLRLRSIVPSGLRLQEIQIDPPGKKLEISGICRDPQDLDAFLQQLVVIEKDLSLQSVVSEAKQSDIAAVYKFRLTMTMEASRHE